MLRKSNKIIYIFIVIFFIFTSSPIYSNDLNYEETSTDNTSEIENTLIEVSASNTTTESLNLNSRSCVVIDRLTQSILYGKNQYNKVKMASTTKIMTAIVVIEQSDLNTTIEVSKKAAGTGGSRLGLKTGDKITIHDLLYGLMLCSGNDSAVALAEAVGGSIQGFSVLMNEKAKELGLTNTNFESPHGLDSDKHYTTAFELALLSDYALKNKTFLNIVATKNYTVTINGYPKTLSNTNELLGNLNGVYGIKTGFTNGANRCLVTACKRNNMDIICVVLGADTKKFRTKDSIKLIEYTFKNYEYVNIAEIINKEFDTWKNEHYNYFNIDKGISSDLELSYSFLQYNLIPIRKDQVSSINISFNISQNLIAPINKNDVIGNINVILNDKLILQCDIFSKTTINKKNAFNYLYDFFNNYSTLLNSLSNNIL